MHGCGDPHAKEDLMPLYGVQIKEKNVQEVDMCTFLNALSRAQVAFREHCLHPVLNLYHVFPFFSHVFYKWVATQSPVFLGFFRGFILIEI